jgi:hypothetical protein
MIAHQSRVFSVALRFTGQRLDAEELLQDVLLQRHAALSQITGEEHLTRWLLRTVTHRCIDQLQLEYAASWCSAPVVYAPAMNPETRAYNATLSAADRRVADVLASTIDAALPKAENKIWHRHPVWFLDGNPIVGYSKQKQGLRLMFWSGADFDEPGLNVIGRKFKDASVFYSEPPDVAGLKVLKRWLRKSVAIQWDYGNLVKRKGRLQRLK